MASPEQWMCENDDNGEPPDCGTRVVATDLSTGQSEECLIEDDYVVITDGNRYVDGIQAYPKSGTVIVTIKRRAT